MTQTNEAGALTIECRELPAFNAGNLDEIRLAFHRAVPCFLRQAWLEKEDVHFTPAVARVGWRGESVLVFAEITDVDIFNQATKFNQRVWELGDAFEIFLRPVEQEAYVEFQVTPENQQLQLRYADAAAFAHAAHTGSIESALIQERAFCSRTWLRPEARRWFVFAEIPSVSVCNKAGPLPGSRWRFSFSRYDYTRGRKGPVISSTSPHTEASFHRQQEWGTINFQ